MSVDVSANKSVCVSVDLSMDVFVGVVVGASVDVSVGDRGLPWYAAGAAIEIAVEIAVDLAVEIAVDFSVMIAVEIATASATGLHGVALLAAAFRGSPWNVRGNPSKVRDSPWSVRGCPWNAVDMAVECRGGPWTLSRCSAQKTNNVHSSTMLRGHCKMDAHKGLTAGRGAAMWWRTL